MLTSHIQEAAQFVANNRLNLTPLPSLLQDWGPKSVEDGYTVQRRAHDILAASLGPVVGHKIGATNAAIQTKLGVGHPCAGGVFAKAVWASGVTLRMQDLVRPGLECEVAFRFGRDLAPRSASYSRDDVIAAIDACTISMEIVDNRHADLAHIHIPTLLSDDTLDAGVILGAPRTAWSGIDLSALTGIIRLHGKEISRGQGSNVMGDPLNAMVWIANTYSGLGLALKRGEFVSTGSIADLIWVKAGEHYEIEIEPLGKLEVNFV